LKMISLIMWKEGLRINMEKLEGQDQLKKIVKNALIEVLEERQDLLHDVIESVIEEIAMCRSIKEGETSATVSREKVFKILEG
jgi:hypothetical protein